MTPAAKESLEQAAGSYDQMADELERSLKKRGIADPGGTQ
jgi:hypothetical protein